MFCFILINRKEIENKILDKYKNLDFIDVMEKMKSKSLSKTTTFPHHMVVFSTTQVKHISDNMVMLDRIESIQ